MGRSKADVRSTYDKIAESYAAARTQPWPEVLDFINEVPAGDLVLDVGCGHGRHSRPLALTGHRVVGIDLSRRLLSIGKKSTTKSREFQTIEWIAAEATALPFPDGIFDEALSIAVLHHLPTREDRVRALEEMRRVLRAGGTAFVTVWSIEHPRVAELLGGRPKKPDVEIPWRLPDGSVVSRPYHLFREGELGESVIESGLQGERFFGSGGNWYALAKAPG
jgi:tRNA (uracil-5-)-methyltransferase TRM9